MSKKTIKANSDNTINENNAITESKQDIFKQQSEEQKYPKELLVKSKQLSQFNLHPCLIRAILTKPEYTLSEAKETIQNYIDSFKI